MLNIHPLSGYGETVMGSPGDGYLSGGSGGGVGGSAAPASQDRASRHILTPQRGEAVQIWPRAHLCSVSLHWSAVSPIPEQEVDVSRTQKPRWFSSSAQKQPFPGPQATAPGALFSPSQVRLAQAPLIQNPDSHFEEILAICGQIEVFFSLYCLTCHSSRGLQLC